jgi:uncharacterized membrane protein
MCVNVGWISVIIGLVLTFAACFYLFHMFPRIAKNQSNVISIVALRFSSWLGLGGLIMLFLGILYLMNKLPW